MWGVVVWIFHFESQSTVAVMLLPFAVVAVALSQVVVIPTNPSELGQRLEGQVVAALKRGGVPLTPAAGLREREATACETNRLCFALLGRVLGTFAVVRVEAATVGTDVAVLVEAIDSATGRAIREDSFVIPIAEIDAALPPRLKPMVDQILAALPPPTPKALVPIAEPPRVDLAPVPLQPKRSAPIWATGTGAIVFAGASAGLFAVSASARSCLQGPPVEGRPTVCVPQSQAASVQQRADVTAVTGAAAAAVAVGLGVAALVQFLSGT